MKVMRTIWHLRFIHDRSFIKCTLNKIRYEKYTLVHTHTHTHTHQCTHKCRHYVITYCDINSLRQHNCFYYTNNYVGYMFRLLNSHLQAYSLQVKSQVAVHTLGSQCVCISEILKPDNLSRKVNVRND